MDLFESADGRPERAVVPPKAERSQPAPLLPSRPIAWEKLLARASTTLVVFHVSAESTGVCVEVLSDPQLGRRWLHQDGSIGEFPPDSAYGRWIYLTPEQFAPIAARAEVKQLGPGGTKVKAYELVGAANA